MIQMTMRERMLAMIQGREHDRIPFVLYDGLLSPIEQVYELLAPEDVGLLRWCPIYRVEHRNCRFEEEEYTQDGLRWRRRVLHTPVGSLEERTAFQPDLQAPAIRQHFVREEKDYDALWYYLRDSVILDNYDQYQRDEAELGDRGWPLAHVERTPWQQLWVQWVSLEDLSVHLVTCPERVARTMELLQQRARKINEIAYRSPAPFIDVPDNITAPAIGTRRFREHCLPLYNELADMLAERNAAVFVHMDGRLKPFWADIAAARFHGLDSFTPVPDCDTTVAEAVSLWPEKRLWVNFPSSVHIASPEQIRATAEAILADAGHTGRLQIQISENVPPGRWRVSFPIIVEAINAFGAP